MKKLTFVLLMLFVVTSMMVAQKSIAVSTFDVMGGAVTKDEAEAITELFISELVSTGKVNVVDRANFDKVIAEMKFQNSDWSNSEKTVSLGNAVNANLVIRGKIMKVGSSMYLSSTVIDLNTANVLSSGREQFNSIDDIFGLLTKYANQTIEGLSLKIGDIGPGGGLIFFIEGSRCLEVSPYLGDYNWYDALEVAKNYNGGGFSDWYLPTKGELNLVYENLVKTGILQDYKYHWSSSELNFNIAWSRSFSDGYLYGYNKYRTYSVQAIRAFNY